MVLPPYAVANDIDLTLPTPSAGKAIVWNSDGTNLENSTVAVNALESTLKGYKESAESAASTATTKAEIASDKADVATAKAQIATDKAAEAATTLASKANKDMDNLSATGKTNVAYMAMPSSSYVDLETPNNATTTDYTAPANGYFAIAMTAATNGYLLTFFNSSSGLLGSSAIGANGELYAFCPAKKDDVCTCYRNGTLKFCRFIYAEGEI